MDKKSYKKTYSGTLGTKYYVINTLFLRSGSGGNGVGIRMRPKVSPNVPKREREKSCLANDMHMHKHFIKRRINLEFQLYD